MRSKLFLIIAVVSLSCLSWMVWNKKSDLITLRASSFEKLPGWKTTNLTKSLQAFQVSCSTFLRQNPQQGIGSEQIHMTVKDWQPACQAAMQIAAVTDETARAFFKKWFTPVEFYQNKPINGLFTGYYLPLLHGSLKKTKRYNVPIYGMPRNIVTVNLGDFSTEFANRRLIGRIHHNKVVPFYSRAEINEGALKEKAPILLWVDSHIDRLFLEIQGSGMIELPNGQRINVGYAGENGAPYTPIGRVLIEKGVLTKERASMQAIKAYLLAHPDEILPVINQNKSFVFFRILNNTAALGAQGVSLTPGYSLAVDRKWIPLGTPLWLNTTRPTPHSLQHKTFQRLMIAQDTGGAIRGTVRGDVFWGAGKRATYIAGHMKNYGHYWLLLPNQRVTTLPNYSYKAH